MLTNSAIALLLFFAATITDIRASPFIIHKTDSGSLSRRATVCNGFEALCTRGFGNLTYIGTHNSYAIGNTVSANQDQPVLQQLNDGIRMLQLQAHNSSGVIRLCHSSCALHDGGTLEDYLKIVKQWLDANPNEVLSLLIVNINNLPATSYASVFTSVGLDQLSYAPSTLPLAAAGWPTLGSLIDSGKRLITFMDNTADPHAVPYIIDEFSNIWETAYNVIDQTFNCAVNRTRGVTSSQMYLINHFLDTPILGGFVPAITKLNQTNAASGYGSIGAQVATCVADRGRPPNFVLLDYYEHGEGAAFQVAASINGVKYSPTSPIAKPPSSSPTSTTNTTLIHTSASIPLVCNQPSGFVNLFVVVAIFIVPLIV